jgi:tetratricopeptide (TPR) repeat protein
LTAGNEASRPFLNAALFAIQVNCSALADKALSQDLILHGLESKPYLILCKLEIQRNNFPKAYEVLKDALKLNGKDSAVWEAIGNLHYIQGRFTESKIAYETVLSCTANDTNSEVKIDLVYIRLGSIFLNYSFDANESAAKKVPLTDVAVNSGRIAKSMFIKACAANGTSKSWLGLGQACFALKEYIEAEDAFSVLYFLFRKQIF